MCGALCGCSGGAGELPQLLQGIVGSGGPGRGSRHPARSDPGHGHGGRRKVRHGSAKCSTRQHDSGPDSQLARVADIAPVLKVLIHTLHDALRAHHKGISGPPAALRMSSCMALNAIPIAAIKNKSGPCRATPLINILPAINTEGEIDARITGRQWPVVTAAPGRVPPGQGLRAT